MEIWKDIIGYDQYQVSNYGRSKLNWTQIEEIRSSHLTSDELAAIYSVHKSTINRIKRKEGWK